MRIDISYEELRRNARNPGMRGAIRHYLGLLADLFRSPSPVMRDIGEILVASTKQRFQTETDPEGRAWAPNSPVTRARKRNPHILTESGMLGDSIRYMLKDGGKGVSIGSNRVYAAMMQLGGKKAMFPHLWGDIPARPYLGVSHQDSVDLLEAFRRRIRNL
jgi:phage virion morphogenesis protein